MKAIRALGPYIGPLALLLALAFISACAPRPTGPEFRPPAKQVWQSFMARQPGPETPAGFWLKASLNCFGPRQDHRVTIEMWGNYNHPVRMDLKAGIGTLFSLWREDNEQWLAYYPREKVAYTHIDGRLGAKSLGLPIPFDLKQLSWLLTGRINRLLSGYKSSKELPGNRTRFTLSDPDPIQTIVLLASGRIQQARGPLPSPWILTFSDFQSTTESIAHKLVLETKDETKIVVRLKEVRWRKSTWDSPALDLDPPPETSFFSLTD